MSKENSEFTQVQIKCALDHGIEMHHLKPEHIPSTGDRIRLDGFWFRAENVDWELDHGIAAVTVHLVPAA
jgi:hypothetical protein